MTSLEQEVDQYNEVVDLMKEAVDQRDTLIAQINALEQKRQQAIGRLQILKELEEENASEEKTEDVVEPTDTER